MISKEAIVHGAIGAGVGILVGFSTMPLFDLKDNLGRALEEGLSFAPPESHSITYNPNDPGRIWMSGESELDLAVARAIGSQTIR